MDFSVSTFLNNWINILDNFGVNVVTAAESYNKSIKNLELAIAAYDQAVITHVADVVLRIAGRTP
jgi:hypothetical protein